MATGAILAGGILAASTGWQQYDVTRAAVEIQTGASAAPLPLGGTFVDTQPIAEIGAALAGSRAPSFVDDFYNRLHYSALAFDVGNIVSPVVRTLSIWNSYFSAKDVTSVEGQDDEGIEVDMPGALPFTIRPLQTVDYVFSISPDGPPILRAVYTFTIDGQEAEISFDGSRITPWLYRPDGEVLERLEWLTDVMGSFDGSEQRAQLRGLPRRFFEFAITVLDRDRRSAENLLFNWQSKVWAVPIWMDAERLAAPLTAGATSISASTATRDYHDGGLVGIMTSPYTYEIIEIDTVEADELLLAQPLGSDWPANLTEIFPMRTARMPDQIRLQRFTGASAYGRFRFQCVDESAYDAASETAYRSYPVLTVKPNWTEDLAQDYLRKMAELDPRVGRPTWDEEGSGAILLQSHRWLLDGRTEIDNFRKWLYARKGRLSAFWMPSWAQDLVVVANIGATALTVDVEHCGYTDTVAQGIARRDIRIELVDGTVFYRRILGSTEVDADTERLTIDADLDQLVPAANIASISFMALVRLDADAAEIAWWKWDAAESSLIARGMRNDV